MSNTPTPTRVADNILTTILGFEVYNKELVSVKWKHLEIGEVMLRNNEGVLKLDRSD